MDHLDSNLLPGFEETHPGRVAGVEVGLSRLNAPRALQERLFIYHHLVAGKICEVYVVHLEVSRKKKKGS